IDVSLVMLLRAKARGGAKGRARFVVADIRRLPFRCRFDLITAALDPLCHLISAADRKSALGQAARCLSRRGRFVLDGLFLPRGIHEPPPRRIRGASFVLTIAERWRRLGRNLWRATYRYDVSGTQRREHAAASFVARAWTLEETRRLFPASG